MLSDKIKELYKITTELERTYPGRKFTVDGHLVGSIGEVIVAEHYGLSLLPKSTKTPDAVSEGGKMVQIKATQVKGISISSEPDYVIVIRIDLLIDSCSLYTKTPTFNIPGLLFPQL